MSETRMYYGLNGLDLKMRRHLGFDGGFFVEGNELQVLEGVDHAQFRFRHLLIECRSLPRMTRYLESHGYRYIEALSGHDHLFSDVRAR